MCNPAATRLTTPGHQDDDELQRAIASSLAERGKDEVAGGAAEGPSAVDEQAYLIP